MVGSVDASQPASQPSDLGREHPRQGAPASKISPEETVRAGGMVPAEEAAPPAAGLLLAAGGGRRYGMPKALVERDGRLLVEHAAQVLRAGGCDPVVVVLGAAADEVRRRADLAGAIVVDNPDWADGMGSSLRAGLAALASTGAPAAT